jgi:hypothetical protein
MTSGSGTCTVAYNQAGDTNYASGGVPQGTEDLGTSPFLPGFLRVDFTPDKVRRGVARGHQGGDDVAARGGIRQRGGRVRLSDAVVLSGQLHRTWLDR